MLAMLRYYLKRPYHLVKTGFLQGVPSQTLAGFPNWKLKITAISGTDGKTTTSTLLHHILTQAGIKAGLISTVAAFIGTEESDTGFHVTSPQPRDMYRFMKKMVQNGFTHLVLETTSHGAYQYRNWGITPQFAGLTNISQEHLDYHLTYQEYIKAKLSFLKKARTLYLNEEDMSFTHIKKLYPSLKYKTYSSSDPLPKVVREAITSRFPEIYNQMNARLATMLAKENGVTDKDIAAAILTFPGVPGRMEVIIKKPVQVIVDFAHTPQGLEAVLTELKKKQKRGKLIAVFGCASKRDTSKRPLMGRIGSEIADYAIFTAEDPRTEDVWAIIREMKDGVTNTHNKILSIPDRREAITFAMLKLAKPGDTVVVLGKGHEQSMCIGTVEYPWSDSTVITEIASSVRTT